MGVLTNVDEARKMAGPGNNKSGHPMLTAIVAIVVGISSGMVPAAFNQWANRSGSNDDLVALRTEFRTMRQQLDRIEGRDFIARSELERTIARLEDRIRELERTVQSRYNDRR